MENFLRITLVLLASLYLAACQSSNFSVQETGFHIAEVDVLLPDQSKKPDFAKYTGDFDNMLTNVISHYAREYNATRPNAKNAYALSLDVKNVHFTNPLLSVVVADPNHISGTMIVTDLKDGRIVLSRNFHSADQRSIAAASFLGPGAALIKKEKKQYHMARGAGWTLMTQVFPKTTLTDRAKRRLRDEEAMIEPTTLSPLSGNTAPAVTAPEAASGEPNGDQVIAAGS